LIGYDTANTIRPDTTIYNYSRRERLPA